jgi:sulfite exporter TauE/SafE
VSLPPVGLGTLVRLLLWSLAVGLVLALLDLSPRELLVWARDTAGGLVAELELYTGRAVSYVLLGAVIVVPIWAVTYLWRALRRG